MQCKANKEASYTWERQGGLIPFSATGLNTNILTMVNLQPEDVGNYRCIATSNSGTSYSTYGKIAIKGKEIMFVLYVLSLL